MVICWVVSGNIKQNNGYWTSDMASNRYRVLIPANKLVEYGHKIHIVVDCKELLNENVRKLEECDVVIFGKSFNDDHLLVAKKANTLGKRIVVDICDNYFFQDASMLAHYQQLIGLSNAIVANSKGMAESLYARFNKPVVVIEDPYESLKQTPRFHPDRGQLNLVWFGYDRNIQALLDEIPNIGRICESIPVKLKIVTNHNEALIKDIDNFNKKHGNTFLLEYIPWSLESTQTALEASDIVLLPNKLVDDGLVKSSNRIIQSLLAGRFVCASPIPSYVEFNQWAYVGENLLDGIVWALNNPLLVESKLAEAQAYIEGHYSPNIIGNKWNQLLTQTFSEDFNGSVAIEDSLVKLNLGCGDKILPGFVNVDVVASRAGKEPDVICDLHNLDVFEDNYADEILSVHVVEHFWRWEVEDVLKEWARVLKPGGKMIIECPNLKSACEEFLKNPDAAASGGPEGQRSMWVFYGDPRWEDPLMVHRWGYTPESLGSLLASIGLVNIRQEPAQYKLREPRDMRIVAEKSR